MREYQKLKGWRRRRLRRLTGKWLSEAGAPVKPSDVSEEEIERFRRARRRKIGRLAFTSLREVAEEIAEAVTTTTDTKVDDMVLEVLEDFFEPDDE